MPFITAALLRMECLRHYDMSELTAARLGAKQQGFIEQKAEEAVTLRDQHPSQQQQDIDKTAEDADDDEVDLTDPIEQNRLLARQYNNGGGGVDYDMAIDFLDIGQTFKMADWQHPNTAYPNFVQTQLRGAAAGLGIPYHQLAGDLSAINFSACLLYTSPSPRD